MKILKESEINIDFDFQKYYRKLGQVESEIEKIKIEALYFIDFSNFKILQSIFYN